jgi:hypothetical protein
MLRLLVLAAVPACFPPAPPSAVSSHAPPVEAVEAPGPVERVEPPPPPAPPPAPAPVVASSDPRLPDLYRCWFERPYANGHVSRLAVFDAPDLAGEPSNVSSMRVFDVSELLPLEIRTVAQIGVRPDPSRPRSSAFYMARRTTVDALPGEPTVVHRHDAPFDLWPVVLSPHPDLADAWQESDSARIVIASEYRFAIDTDPFQDLVAGVEDSAMLYRLTRLERSTNLEDLRDLAHAPLYLAAPRGGFPAEAEPAVRITLDAATPMSTSLIGPGVYTIDLDGSLRPADPR